MKQESCVQLAQNAGYRYAGLQWYGYCFAGNTLGYAPAPESECNTPCTANPSEMCGGGWRNSICRTPVSTAPDLTASTPTPTTATVNVAQTFSSTITNIGNASTGASFSNFFQVATGADGGGAITDLTATLCQLWLSMVQVLLPLHRTFTVLPERIQLELALIKVHLRISELLPNQMKTTTAERGRMWW